MDAILTTAQAAKLLGVSVRTAQQWIETGVIHSWKTPGGHRRVYQSDVLALQQGHAAEPTSIDSARVVVIAPAEQHAAYHTALGHSPDWLLEFFDDRYAALLALGARPPAILIIDIGRETAEFACHVSASPLCGLTDLLLIADGDAPSEVPRARAVSRDTAALVAIVTDLMRGPIALAEPISGNFPIGANESLRLAALQRTGLLDTGPEAFFDQLTWLASRQFGTPIALMTLITSDRQWFKSRVGIPFSETARDRAFCNHTLLQKDVFVVNDLAADVHFRDYLDVREEPHLRFYAGTPIFDAAGYALGSLCLIDYRPRDFTEIDRETLKALARLATEYLAQRQGVVSREERKR